MLNLRINSLVVVDSTNITVDFTKDLSPNLINENVVITSQSNAIPNPEIISIEISGSVLNIITQPLTPLANYTITFKSLPEVQFKSLNSDAILYEDGISNVRLIYGPLESSNEIRKIIEDFHKDNIYDLSNETILGKFTTGLSKVLSRALYDVRQLKNERYLSFTVTDEKKTRGEGPFDRLDEECAYEVLRVGKMPTRSPVAGEINYSSFPKDIVSLQAADFNESLIPGNTSKKGYFNLRDLTLNLSKNPVIKASSIIILYNNGNTYTYDIPTLGYQILDSRYDKSYAFSYLTLSDNQIKLNSNLLEQTSLNDIYRVKINYTYKNLGKKIDPASLVVSTNLLSSREVLDPIKNVLNLKHAPIVDNSGKTYELGGVTFSDPNTLNTKHPAFKFEIKFRNDYLPSRQGEYSIDYSTGTIYVFGESKSKQGTGGSPPLATYQYKLTFVQDLDYTFDSDTLDLVALPDGNLLESPAKISFNYEESLIPGVDYNPTIHQESLNERIENRLLSLSSLRVKKTPITSVFSLYNETTGETYPVSRFTDDKVYFTYTTPPSTKQSIQEQVNFQDINNEILLVNEVLSTAIPNSKIYKILLNNNQITSATQDGIGYLHNSTLNFSNTNFFMKEKYFDNSLVLNSNFSLFTTQGDYSVDYKNGIIYVVVSNSADNNIGSVSYRNSFINLNYPHVLAVEDIYNFFEQNFPNEKSYTYSSLHDGYVVLNGLTSNNESFLNEDQGYSYYLYNNNIGTFSPSFFSGVSNNVKALRKVFEYEDLRYNPQPLNFAESSSFNNKIITVNSLVKQEYSVVQFDGVNYYVNLNFDYLYSSPNISVSVSAIRNSDGLDLWNGSSSIVTGSPIKIILTNNSPAIGDTVIVTVSFTINNSSKVVVDYSKGELCIDYTYLADEILVTYEYGDNSLDFRQSKSVSAGTDYYVTYKAGALRNALLNNFGTLLNIPILSKIDNGFPRERYRDALMAAMESVLNPSTIAVMENLVENIVHTKPEIIESALLSWLLGISYLNPSKIKATGEFDLLPGKFGSGALIKAPNTVELPLTSNLRLEEGTLETWVIPQWNYLDNDADLEFVILKDGSKVPESFVFIGATEYHPEYSYDYKNSYYKFNLNKHSNVEGTPNTNKDGVYIYLDWDITNTYKRWNVKVQDGYGNVSTGKNYKVIVKTNGKLYNLAQGEILPFSVGSLTTRLSEFLFNFDSTQRSSFDLNFISDRDHFIFDFKENNNRFSLFKDVSGYLNFKVTDKNSKTYTVSSILDWKANEKHHVACSWKLNTQNNRDEMHLFIDGKEVPNILRYGSRIAPYLHEKFRTVNPEEVVGIVPKNIVNGSDLITNAGSNIVSSSSDFTALGILAGDTIYIEESGFDPNGYTITSVNQNVLTLSLPMPFYLKNVKYSINKVTFQVSTEIDIFPNFYISTLHSFASSNDLSTVLGSSTVTSSITDFVSLGVSPGDLIRIDDSNFEKHYVILSVSTNSLVVNDDMPISLSSLNFYLYKNSEEEIPGLRALHPSYSISKDGYYNNYITLRNNVYANDIILLNTLGINHQKIKQKVYVWGDGSNVIKTKLPPPISLDEVSIRHVILDSTAVGPNNSTLIFSSFVSNNLTTYQPSLSDNGRTLEIQISGKNVDFSSPTFVTIVGYQNANAVIETLTFNDFGSQFTTNQFTDITYINSVTVPIDPAKDALVLYVKEKNSLTQAESSNLSAVIRYSYQSRVGSGVFGSGNTITESGGLFSDFEIGNYIHIFDPLAVQGYYLINSISPNRESLIINASLPSFTDGYYEILNFTTARSGFQNGKFVLEKNSPVGEPYLLKEGVYEFDYYTYMKAEIDKIPLKSFIGSDFEGKNQFNGVIDEFIIYRNKLTDVRIGESSTAPSKSVTRDFNSLKKLDSSKNMLTFIGFDSFPFENSVDYYRFRDKTIYQCGDSVNSSFEDSIILTDNGILKENLGILNTRTGGTIEFWVSPIYDTGNDPNTRFYFDATSLVKEEVVSLNNVTLELAGSPNKIISIIDKNNPKINYSVGATIEGNFVYIKAKLLKQNTKVTVTYAPSGTSGDRISILKDKGGYLNFTVIASGVEYSIKYPIFWSRGSWHRIKAQYSFNSGNNSDQMHLFIDGIEKGNVLFSSGLILGTGTVFGSAFSGRSSFLSESINFKDNVNYISFGSDYLNENKAFALFDNFRISDTFRPLYAPFGEAIDVNYNSNTSAALPVTEDLYTTLLLNYNTEIEKVTNFAIAKSKKSSLFEFYITIFDSYGIVAGSDKVKEILETLIKTFKPANSKAFINYK